MTQFPDAEPTNDFRSDTFTVPTKEMNQRLIESLQNGELRLGDSVYKEDQPTLELETMMSEVCGKEAALFCSSGTLSNQIGLRANLHQPPYSILCDHRAHVFLHEAGGLAALSQAMVHPVIPANGDFLTLQDVLDNFTPSDGDIHGAPTKVISLENTLHGIVTPVEEIRQIAAFARENGIRLHLDGARLYNASVATGVSIREYCSHFDSVSICLSKSVGAPMGSVLVGNRDFIETANHFKKQCGGGIRQVGLMTFMAKEAVLNNVAKIQRSHDFAAEVAEFCSSNNIHLESPADTNFVFLDMKRNQMSDTLLVELGTKHGVKLMGKRIAFHFQNTREAVDRLKMAILECKNEALRNPCSVRASKKMYSLDAVKQIQEKVSLL